MAVTNPPAQRPASARRMARKGRGLRRRAPDPTPEAARIAKGLTNAQMAVISPCGTWRYRLEREVAPRGPVFAYFGVNGSTADAEADDHTVRKWRGFTLRNGGSRFIVGNPFGYRATDVRELATAADPVGPDNARHLAEIIHDADVLIPCWGSRTKLPKHLRPRLDILTAMLRRAGKPVRIFGLTKSGDPIHPLMLGYETPLSMWIDDGRPLGRAVHEARKEMEAGDG